MASPAVAKTFSIIRFLQTGCGQGGANVSDRSAIPDDHILGVDDADSDASKDYAGDAILTILLLAASNHSN